MNKNNILTLLPTLLCSVYAMADTTLQYTTSESSQQPGTVYLSDQKLRVDNAGDANWILYDRNQNTLFIIDDNKQEYYAFDEQQIQALGDTIGNVNKQLESALASLPPEQRAQARALMQSMLPGGSSSAASAIEKAIDANYTGQYDNVAGIRCERVEVMLNNQVQSELCLADPDALNLSSNETATLESMAEFAQSMLTEIKANAGSLLPDDFSAGDIVQVLQKGVPVRMTDKSDSTDDTATLASIEHDNISTDIMQIPTNYQRKQLDLGL